MERKPCGGMWHRKWQGHMIENGIEIEVAIGARRADAVVDKNVYEFQHSYISAREVAERTRDWRSAGYGVHWIVDGNEKVTVSKDKMGTVRIRFSSFPLESFMSEPHIYMQCGDGNVYVIRPMDVCAYYIVVGDECVFGEADFINLMKTDQLRGHYARQSQCVLYINQRGAGNGKTYQAVRAVADDNRFAHKSVFIYLTKMHSAKTIIKEEFKSQFRVHIEKEDVKIYTFDVEAIGRKDVYIGTIDSFMYALGDKQAKGTDFFAAMIDSIPSTEILSKTLSQKGKVERGYGGRDLFLTKTECIVIVDEAQDLPPRYLEAMLQIMKRTHVDVFVIGDKLQSLYCVENIMTCFREVCAKEDGVDVVYDIGENRVERFHSTFSMDFVNSCVPFEKYGLRPITGICQRECNYRRCHEDPYQNVKVVPTKFAEAARNEVEMLNIVADLVIHLSGQVDEHGYAPQNVMFIFPNIKKNPFATRLYEAVEEFWEKKSECGYLPRGEKEKLSFERAQANQRWAHVHYSESGRPIDLNVSNDATRMVSIHASKGDGRELVYVIGIADWSLKQFTCGEKNLMFDSLMHVAMTRHKCFLYVAVDSNPLDEVFQRLSHYMDSAPKLIPSAPSDITWTLISAHINDTSWNLELYDFLATRFPGEFQPITSTTSTGTKPVIIEQQDHIFRLKSMEYHTWISFGQSHTAGNQVYPVIRKIGQLMISLSEEKVFFLRDDAMRDLHQKNIVRNGKDGYAYHGLTTKWGTSAKTVRPFRMDELKGCSLRNGGVKDYFDRLKKVPYFQDPNDPQFEWETRIFPVLVRPSSSSFGWDGASVLLEYLKTMQKKINRDEQLPIMCSAESLILVHIVAVLDGTNKRGLFHTGMSIVVLYNMLEMITNCSKPENASNHKRVYRCACHKIVRTRTETDRPMEDAIASHYKEMELIRSHHIHFKSFVEAHYTTKPFDYKLELQVRFQMNNGVNVNTKRIAMLGINDTHVVNFVIQPHVNALNRVDIFLKAMFDTYIIFKCQDNRYIGKRILTCFLTLDSDIPRIECFDDEATLAKMDALLQDYLQRGATLYTESGMGIRTRYHSEIYHLWRALPKLTSFDCLLEILQLIRGKTLGAMLTGIGYQVGGSFPPLHKDDSYAIQFLASMCQMSKLSITRELVMGIVKDETSFIRALNEVYVSSCLAGLGGKISGD